MVIDPDTGEKLGSVRVDPEDTEKPKKSTRSSSKEEEKVAEPEPEKQSTSSATSAKPAGLKSALDKS